MNLHEDDQLFYMLNIITRNLSLKNSHCQRGSKQQIGLMLISLE